MFIAYKYNLKNIYIFFYDLNHIHFFLNLFSIITILLWYILKKYYKILSYKFNKFNIILSKFSILNFGSFLFDINLAEYNSKK